MEITKIATLTEEEITILKTAGSLGKAINAAFEDSSVTKLDENSLGLIKAVIEVLSKAANR